MNDKIKIKLAQAYKILSALNFDDHTYTHLSSRSAEADSFYIYPFGLRFEEATEDNLMKVDFDGNVLEGNEFQYNKTGYNIHSIIYKIRPDINSVFHIHTPAIVAVSVCKKGLMPISQWALHFYEQIAYHDYDSLSLNKNQASQLASDLGDKYTMLMRNHGSLTCGKTIYEAMFYTYHLEQAAKTQIALLSMNQEYITPLDEICKKTVSDLLNFEKNLGKRDWDAWIRMIDKNCNIYN